MERIQKSLILKDLKKKMVFIVGPRQVGKTWLSKNLVKEFSNHQYLNYDDFEDRKIIRNKSWLPKVNLLIFDELHKMKGWKNYLKGVFDTKDPNTHILVTGSARLDTFRQAGDSLAGRFFGHRLYPFTLLEFSNFTENDFDKLIQRGGFPEPFLAESENEANRWRQQYLDGLIRTDILDFEKIHDLRAILGVLDRLRNQVGSPVSYKAISEDVQISPLTVKKYIQILEALFIVFIVRPFSKNMARSILKEPKIYFFDTGLVKGDEGARFENHMALELLRRQHALADYKGADAGLFYLRTKDKKEVDFVLVENEKIETIVEVKISDRNISKNLKFFTQKYDLPGVQVLKNLRNGFREGKIEVRNALEWLSTQMVF